MSKPWKPSKAVLAAVERLKAAGGVLPVGTGPDKLSTATARALQKSGLAVYKNPKYYSRTQASEVRLHSPDRIKPFKQTLKDLWIPTGWSEDDEARLRLLAGDAAVASARGEYAARLRETRMQLRELVLQMDDLIKQSKSDV